MSQSPQQLRAYIDKAKNGLSLVKQCDILEIQRSGLYYKPTGESRFNLELMRLIDEEQMLHPWLGVPRMTTWLREDKGLKVNTKQIERLYRLMGISAIGPKPNTSKPAKGPKRYPYLLRNLKITHLNQVWAMVITYIPVQGGYLYLVAAIDLFSRYVLNWSLSNTMSSKWCLDVLKEAVEKHGKPKIVNTDQGSQFTADEFANYVVNDIEIELSMDGKGRAIDNIFIERLWLSVKYEHVYLFPASDGIRCYNGLKEYFEYYNTQRRHQSINEQFPENVFENHLNKVA